MPLEKKLNDSYILGNEKKNFLYLLKKDKVSLSDTSSNIFSSSSSYGQSNTNISSNSINPKQNKKSIKEEFLKWLNEKKDTKIAFEKPTIEDIKKKVLDEEDAFQKEMPDMQKRFDDLISKDIKNYEEKI